MRNTTFLIVLAFGLVAGAENAPPDITTAILTFNVAKCSALGMVVADDGRGVAEIRAPAPPKPGLPCEESFPLVPSIIKPLGTVTTLKWALSYGAYGTGGGLLEYYMTADGSHLSEVQDTFYFSNGTVLCNTNERTAILLHRSDSSVTLVFAQPPRDGATPKQGFEQLHAVVSGKDGGEYCAAPDFHGVMLRILRDGAETVAKEGGRALQGARGVARISSTTEDGFWASSTCVGCQGEVLMHDLKGFPFPRFGELNGAAADVSPSWWSESAGDPATVAEAAAAVAIESTNGDTREAEAAVATRGSGPGVGPAIVGGDTAGAAVDADQPAAAAAAGSEGTKSQLPVAGEEGGGGGVDADGIGPESEEEVHKGAHASLDSLATVAATGSAVAVAAAAGYVVFLRRRLRRDGILPLAQDF